MQSVNILAFPSVEDQQVIQTAVETFLYTQTGKTREIMLKTIRAVLDRYGITKFGFAEYFVYATSEPRWSIVKAKHAIQDENCPGCGDHIYIFTSKIRILSIEEHPIKHYVSYGCRCGRVFGKWEPAK